MLCLLDNIENEVQEYANIISNIIGTNVEVADTNMRRLAGTGIFEDEVYEIKTGCIYDFVLESQELLIVENPKESMVCNQCSGRLTCSSKLLIVVPLIYNGESIGVIGVVCLDQEDKERIMKDLDSYLFFLNHISELISEKMDTDEANKKRDKDDVLKEILSNIGRSGLVVDDRNNLIFMNNIAKMELDISNYNLKENIKVGLEERDEVSVYTLNLNEKRYLIEGEKIFLKPIFKNNYNLLIFKKVEEEEIVLDENPHGDRRVSLDSIIGESYPMKELKKKIVKVAETQSTVLISGASGTGKELVARAIHNCSPRRNKRFIAVNCSALPESLIESELFGYTKGAFTGANPGGKVGKFELANDGVIFLDEIGDMPLDTQVKLLRILEERRVIPIGSNIPVDLNIRIIAATNIDLEERIREKKFREDLYYRLNVIPMEMPVLKDREEDIKIFIDKFLNKYNKLFGKYVHTIEDDCIEVLANYSWPGNVRELQNTVEYLVNISDDDGIITKSMLPDNILHPKRKLSEEVVYTKDGIKPLMEIEIEHIKKALDICGKDTDGKKEASERLGIGIATLYRRLKEIE